MLAADSEPSPSIGCDQVAVPKGERQSRQKESRFYDRLSGALVNRKADNAPNTTGGRKMIAVAASDTATAIAGHCQIWRTGTRTKTMFEHIRYENGTIVSENDHQWIAVLPEGFRMMLNKETSEIEIDQRVANGPFVEFVERAPLADHLSSKNDPEKKQAIKRLLNLLARSITAGGEQSMDSTAMSHNCHEMDILGNYHQFVG